MTSSSCFEGTACTSEQIVRIYVLIPTSQIFYRCNHLNGEVYFAVVVELNHAAHTIAAVTVSDAIASVTARISTVIMTARSRVPIILLQWIQELRLDSMIPTNHKDRQVITLTSTSPVWYTTNHINIPHPSTNTSSL